MEKDISDIKEAFEEELINAKDAVSIEGLRVKYLGRKGIIAALMQKLPGVAKELKPKMGKELNILKKSIEEKIKTAQNATLKNAPQATDNIDITLPGTWKNPGKIHPITRALN